MDNVVSLDAHRPVPEWFEKPSEVLPPVEDLLGPVAFDSETTGLHPDDGATLAVSSVAYRLKSDPHFIYSHAFAFDQGRASDKGFEEIFYQDTPTARKNKTVGLPKGDTEGRWDWGTDYNLPALEWTVLLAWLLEAGEANGLIGHNVRFDLWHHRNGTRHFEGVELEKFVIFDTMLAASEVWPTQSMALKNIGARLWGDDEVEEAGEVKEALIEVKKRYGLRADHGPRYDLAPASAMLPYAAQDTVLTLRLYETEVQLLDEGVGSWEHVDDANKLMRVLYRMERRGLGPIDIPLAEHEAEIIEARLRELEPVFPFQPPTGPKAAAYYFDELGYAPWKNGEETRHTEIVPDLRKGAAPGATRRKIVKQGGMSAAIARRMAAKGAPYAAEYAEYTELKTIVQMFYRKYANLTGKDGMLRTSFKQNFVKSGRMSVERFQAQALPKKIGVTVGDHKLVEPRKLFLVAPGLTRINLDLTQAELRIAAKLSGCDTMLTMLETGADFHGSTTRNVFEIDSDHPEWSFYRDIGKRLTFGSIFMIGAQRFQATLWKEAEVDWSLSRCKDAVYAWRDTYPEFGIAYEHWMQHFDRHGWVPLIDGMPTWKGQFDYENTGWSRRVQGSLAIFVRKWLVQAEIMTAKYGALRLTVHDSLVADVPTELADEICVQLIQMTEELWMATFGIAGTAERGEFAK